MDESKMEQGVSQVDSRFVFDFGDTNSSDKASVLRSKHSVMEQRRRSKIIERQVFDEMPVREVSLNTMGKGYAACGTTCAPIGHEGQGYSKRVGVVLGDDLGASVSFVTLELAIYSSQFLYVPPQQVKPKGRVAGTKKAPAKKKEDVEVDKDMEPSRARLAAYNLDSSPDNSAGTSRLFWISRLWETFLRMNFRGAYNMMAMLPKEQLERGVVCSSAGNHAQGVALAAKRLGCNAVIVMPITTPEIKWKSVKRLRATVLLIGDSYDEAQEYAKMRARKEGQTFVPPFDHPDAIMGQGTVGMEIFRQIKDPLHAIFVPIGGGRLIAGIATYVKRVSPK
ncbi:hypothetical protein Drorol1_Dr00025643, partial [Drosera rotundifolia]